MLYILLLLQYLIVYIQKNLIFLIYYLFNILLHLYLLYLFIYIYQKIIFLNYLQNNIIIYGYLIFLHQFLELYLGIIIIYVLII